jgi:diguanylate cyclase (GGDEF)-like protein
MISKITIGLLAPFLGGYYYNDFTSSIQSEVQSRGARLIAIRSAGNKLDVPIAVDLVDAWIVLLNPATDPYLQYLHDVVKKPIVTIARDITSLHIDSQMVFCDNEGGIKQAFQHLIGHGHREIGFIGYQSLDDMRLRLKGYREVLAEHQMNYNPDHVIDPGDFGIIGGRRAADQIVQSGFPFRAAVVGTDLNAVGMIERFTELGYRVPEDFAIIGFDNTKAGFTCSPKVSTVDQNLKQIGRTAVGLLFGQLNQTKVEANPFLVECNLIIRGSCGCDETTHIEKEFDLNDHSQNTRDQLEKTMGTYYEFYKFIMNYKLEAIKDLAWVFAPFYQWGCLGIWNDDTEDQPKLHVSQYYHFKQNYELTNLVNVELEQFPVHSSDTYDLQVENTDIIYLIPFRAGDNHWNVLAMGSDFMDSPDQIIEQDSLINYLDMIANSLEHQALLEEMKHKSEQFKRIAEQLEVVSRTSNDGIWDWDLFTGTVNWNQRLFNLLSVSEPCLFEDIVHPDDYILYSRALQAHLQEDALFEIEVRLQKKQGDYVWVVASGEALYDKGGMQVRMIGSVRDISQRKHSEAQMHHLAYHDSLTGLSNRFRFYQVIQDLIKYYPKQSFAIMVLDLDHFKKVNDTYGHQMGDRLLEYIAAQIKNIVQISDHIARFGGDEIVLICPYELYEEVEEFTQTIALQLSIPMVYEAVQIGITTSIGISLYPLDGQDPDTLIKKADIAMFKAKQAGKNRFELFSPHMIEQTMWRINMENQLQAALINDEFVLHYQPQMNLQTGEIFGVEALLRWDSPARGLVSPLEFITLAEETGLIIPIGEWVILEACRQNKRWMALGYKPIKISVNISGRQLKQVEFVANVKRIIEKTEMNPLYLCLEITESTIIDNLEETIEMLKELSALGIQIALDDFGTGYSSLSILKKLPISMVKIDKSFIGDMTLEHHDLNIVKAIIFISKSMQLEVVAEGIEQKEQFDLLKELGCHYMQGFYISGPLSAEKIILYFDNTINKKTADIIIDLPLL